MDSSKTWDLSCAAEPNDQRKRKPNNHYGFFRAHAELFLCFLGWASLGLSLVLYFRERTYRVGFRSSLAPLLPLHQVEVSSLITAIEAIIRSFFAAWCGIVAWRIIYMLLLTRGTTFREISSIAYPLPPSLQSHHFGKHSFLSASLFVVVLLSLPVQYFSSPLLSSSISWRPSQYQGDLQNLTAPVAGESRGWDQYNSSPDERKQLVLRSVGLALTNNADSLQGISHTPRRTVEYEGSLPVNSTTELLQFPFFVVDHFEWIRDIEESLPDEIMASLMNDKQGFLNISGPDGVITQGVEGNMAVLRDYAWTPASTNETNHEGSGIFRSDFPRKEQQEVSNQLYVAVLIHSLENSSGQDDWNKTCTSKSAFAKMPKAGVLQLLYTLVGRPYKVACYAVAKVAVRAGSLDMGGRLISPGRFQAVGFEEVVGNVEKTLDSPDALTRSILEAMPEVMANLVSIMPAQTSKWDSLEGYARDMLMMSYQATWNVMTDTFQSDARPLQVYLPLPAVTFTLLQSPFLCWIGLVCCALLSGFAFIFVESYAESRYGIRVDLRDTVIAPLRLDMSNVPWLDESVKLSKDRKDALLSFETGRDPSSEGSKNTHPIDYGRMRTVYKMLDRRSIYEWPKR